MNKDILNFLTEFLNEEIELHYKSFDKNFSSESYKEIGTEFVDKYFVSYLKYALGGGYTYKSNLDFLPQEAIEANLDKTKFATSILFRVEHYKNPNVSKAFRSLGKIEEIFVCYLSGTLVLSNKKVSSQLILCELDNEYKIIAERFPIAPSSPNSYESIPWGEFTAQADGYKIDNYGELVEVMDLVLPKW